MGRLEVPPPTRFPGVQFNSLPYYLNTWNRLIVIGPGKLLPFTFKIAVSFSSFADNMMRLYHQKNKMDCFVAEDPCLHCFNFDLNI